MQDKELVAVAKKGEKFYTKLRGRIVTWLDAHTKVDVRIREYLLLLPDLFVLVVRVLTDARIDFDQKIPLIGAITYVVSPIDLIPDVFMPVGFIDDVVALIFTISKLIQDTGESGAAILQEHWEGSSDLLEMIQKYAGEIDQVLDEKIIAKLKQMFGDNRPSS